MLEARIQPDELWQVIEHVIADTGDLLVQHGLDLHQVDKVSVHVERWPLQSQLEAIRMGMRLVLLSPISADEKMPGGEGADERKSVHLGQAATPSASYVSKT